MRPDQRWFPTNRTDRAAWFQNFAVQFTHFGPTLGFTPAEIDSVNADNEVMQFTSAALTALDAGSRGVREFERLITGGRNDGSEPNFHAVVLPPPPPMVPAGIFERLENIVRRIRLAHGYTPVAGAQLGIIPSNARPADAGLFVPRIKVAATADPYSFTVQVTRKSFHGFRVYYKRASADDWEGDLLFGYSPATITVAPLEPGRSEMLEVRVRMAMNNTAVSMPSNIHRVALMP